MARRMTDAGVARIKQPGLHADPQLPGHFIRVAPTGGKSFVVVVRNAAGKQVWHTVGRFSDMLGIEEAREKAAKAVRAIKEGRDLVGPQGFKTVSDKWFTDRVEGRGLRSAAEIRRELDKHILPAWSDREFASIRRRDVSDLLDEIEEKSGPVAADNVLTTLRVLFNWYEGRSDDYVSPIVKAMARNASKARDRILNDDEIRMVWKAAESIGTYGAIVRLLLLTGQRREKVAAMRWAEVSLDGVWSIPSEDREKGNGAELVLPDMALEIIKAQPRIADNPFVFAARSGDGHFSGYSKGKAKLDELATIGPWKPHDLRRTASSLMARAGVNERHAERALGHAIKGVEGIYNRHSYRAEKAEALRMLADLVEKIVRSGETSMKMAS